MKNQDTLPLNQKKIDSIDIEIEIILYNIIIPKIDFI